MKRYFVSVRVSDKLDIIYIGDAPDKSKAILDAVEFVIKNSKVYDPIKFAPEVEFYGEVNT